MEFSGPGKPLTQDSLDEARGIVGIPLASMWAVIAVESSGAGYEADRRPKILFERHKFHRATGGRYDATHPDISNAKAGGYGKGGVHQYERLSEALKLNRQAALASASWGLGQVLGSNFAVAGFQSVEDMVAKMVQSERQQLLGMFDFISANNLGTFLKNKDWLSFALGYNGQNAEENGYPRKLEAAFDAFKAGSVPEIRVRIAQVALTFLGHKPGGVDGIFGGNTRKALNRFQVAEGMPQSQILGASDFDALVEKAFDGSLES